MAYLKKSCRCNNCGQLMPVGTSVNFEKRYRPIIDSRGFKQSEKIVWLISHSRYTDCQAYSADCAAKGINP